MAASPHVIDVTSAGFADAVIERSKTVPVLVDFWASWCGPCRALGPILEKLADGYAGGFILAKVDTDQEQALAQQFQIRSLPTVTLFRDGKAISSFSGALPEGQIRHFLDQHQIAEGGTSAQWSEDPIERLTQLRVAVAEHPDRASLALELALALLATEESIEAGRLLEALPTHLYNDARAVRARAQLALHRLLLDPSHAMAAPGIRAILAGDETGGMDQLLDLLREQKADERSGARLALVEVTHLLADEARVRDLRRRMAAVLF